MRSIAARPPRRCSIDGDGIVILAVPVVTDFRNLKSSTMIGREQPMRPVTVANRWLFALTGDLEFFALVVLERHAVELRQEVQVPPIAPELAVRHRP